MDNKINRLHEWSLRTVHSDQTSTFEELLERDKTFSIIRMSKVKLLKFTNL